MAKSPEELKGYVPQLASMYEAGDLPAMQTIFDSLSEEERSYIAALMQQYWKEVEQQRLYDLQQEQAEDQAKKQAELQLTYGVPGEIASAGLGAYLASALKGETGKKTTEQVTNQLGQEAIDQILSSEVPNYQLPTQFGTEAPSYVAQEGLESAIPPSGGGGGLPVGPTPTTPGSVFAGYQSLGIGPQAAIAATIAIGADALRRAAKGEKITDIQRAVLALPTFGASELINPLVGMFGDKDRWKTEKNQLEALQEAGTYVPENLYASMPTRGRSRDELMNTTVSPEYVGRDPSGNWVNNLFAQSRNEANLRPEDIVNYSAFAQKDPNWFTKPLDERLTFAQRVLDAGAVNEHHGTIDIDWNKLGNLNTTAPIADVLTRAQTNIRPASGIIRPSIEESNPVKEIVSQLAAVKKPTIERGWLSRLFS